MDGFIVWPDSLKEAKLFMQNLEKQYFVYITANKPNGTLYIGVTSDLLKRIWEHKNHLVEGFSKKYDVTQLVYFEIHQDIEKAIIREKRLKKWKRSWKIDLIVKSNPTWCDLFDDL